MWTLKLERIVLRNVLLYFPIHVQDHRYITCTEIINTLNEFYSPLNRPKEWQLWSPCCLGLSQPPSLVPSSVRWGHSTQYQGVPLEPWPPCWYRAQAAAPLPPWELSRLPQRCMRRVMAVKLRYQEREKLLTHRCFGQGMPIKDLEVCTCIGDKMNIMITKSEGTGVQLWCNSCVLCQL